MIQRIQTIYILIATICLSIVTLGHSILIYFFESTRANMESFQLTLNGIENQEKIATSSAFNIPLNFVSYLLIILLLISIFSFKNLKRQDLLVKIGTLVYSLILIFVVIVYFFNDLGTTITNNTKYTPQFDAGFFILCVGLPALILANNGIKRDKKLIDSLNRLR